MRRLPLLAALVLLPVAAQAQTASGTVGAVARVQSSVTFMAPARSLDFGAITPGTLTTVAPSAGGLIGLRYNTSATVVVSGLTLTHATLPGITLTPSVTCAQDAGSAAASPTTFTCGSGYSTALAANALTTWYFYIGGSITGAQTSTIAAGVYNGSVTLTATFTTY
jgi:hypothetical protein